MSLIRYAHRLAVCTTAIALAIGAGALVLPAALSSGRLLLPSAEPEDIVRYRLSALPPSVYTAAIEASLSSDDPELADSLVVLADDRKIDLPAELRQKVAAAQDFQIGRSVRETWKGLSGGDASSPEALAGAVAADLSGITDVRDLLREGRAYLDDQPYYTLTLGLAAAGLTATGATVFSIGTAAPARVGVTALKVASKAGSLRPPLRRALVTLTTELIDGPALRTALTLLWRGDVSAARLALGKAVRAAPLQTIRTMSAELGTVAKTRGYRSAHDVLKLSDSPRDVSRMAGLASRLGTRFRGAMVLLGTGALTLAGLATTIAGWLAAAGFWLLSVLYIVYRTGRWLLRVARRPRRDRSGSAVLS